MQLLGKLQVDTKKYKEAETTYLELAAADVPEITKQEAELTAYQVGIRAGKHEEALKKLKVLEAKLPKGSKYQGLARIAQAECLIAANKDSEAIVLLRRHQGDGRQEPQGRRLQHDQTPWAHLDIAGTAMSSVDSEINRSWGSGFGVRLLDRLIADQYERR